MESSFRKLRYTVGLSNFYSKKPEFIQQEIWARLITLWLSIMCPRNYCGKMSGMIYLKPDKSTKKDTCGIGREKEHFPAENEMTYDQEGR